MRSALSRFERDLLLLCAGVEMDAQIAQRCAQIQGQSQRAYATFGLALVAPGRSSLERARACEPAAPLAADRSGRQRRRRIGRLRIDERILHYLAGVNYLDTRLQPLLRCEPTGSADGPGADGNGRQHRAPLLETTPTCPPVVVLTGDDLLGQTDVASQVASQLGLHLHVLSAEHIPASAAEIAALATLWQREAVLLGSALLIECDDRAMHRQTASLVEQLSCLVFVSGPGSVRHQPRNAERDGE